MFKARNLIILNFVIRLFCCEFSFQESNVERKVFFNIELFVGTMEKGYLHFI